MGESLTMRRRVYDDGPGVVKYCQVLGNTAGRNVCCLTKAPEEATANFVPAAAVIRRWQALFGFIGHKGHAGGVVSQL